MEYLEKKMLIENIYIYIYVFWQCDIRQMYHYPAVYQQRKEDKKSVLPPIISDVELATLREIPRGNFVQSNALYASTLQNDPDDSALPKIKQEQITLAKFLGSGAFGKVKFNFQHSLYTIYLCYNIYEIYIIIYKCIKFF